MSIEATLHFFCGKMASGKTTLANELLKKHEAVLLSEDLWLSQLYPEEILGVSEYIKYSLRLKNVLLEHVKMLLLKGNSVILDFPGNTVKQRAWFRKIFEQANVPHVLHYVDVSDETCKQQLEERSKNKQKGDAFTSEKEFEEITRYFEEPSDAECFNIKRYVRGGA